MVVFTNVPHATPSVQYVYDPLYLRLTSITDGTGSTAYTYHPSGTLGAGELATVDGPLTNDTLTYTYDQLGRVVSSDLHGVTETRTYDALERVLTQANALGTFTFT